MRLDDQVTCKRDVNSVLLFYKHLKSMVAQDKNGLIKFFKQIIN